MSLLTLEGVELFYGQFQALFGLSLTVEQGETVAVIGANGAGKTSLMRAIAGAHPPARGTVAYRGESISGKRAYDLSRKGIALVPEGRKLFPSLTVEENLKIGAYCGRKGPWSLERVYQLFPALKERCRHSGADISGGQQQMAAIGRALMSNPELILMDEISLGLAPVVINDLYRVIPRIAEAGTTVVLVEQDVGRSLKAAGRVYCLLEGKISLAARPAEVNTDQIRRAYFGV